MNGWLIFLALLAGYLGILALLRNRAQALPGGFEVQGPFVLWKTQFGKPWLERVARGRAFWNVLADVGIVVTWVIGLLVFAVLIWNLWFFFAEPATAAANAQPPQFLIGLPGVNPLIPVGYGIVALILALVIHEGSHGVMAYASRMRVKSLGLLFFIIPVGAFVEPDEEDLERATTREKNRVFAAGPTSNIILALVAGVILSTAFMGSMTIANGGAGVPIANVEPDSAAHAAGLQEGDVLLRLDGLHMFADAPADPGAGPAASNETADSGGAASNDTADPSESPAANETDRIVVENVTLTDQEVYSASLARSVAGSNVTLVFERDGVMMTSIATLKDKHEYYERVAPTINKDEFRGKGFLGVRALDTSAVGTLRDIIASPFSSVPAFLLYISYPFVIFFQKVDIFAPPYSGLFTIEGPLAALPPEVFFGTATLLYWIVWINVMLGTFNALPAGPLDGGQMFRATLRERLFRRYGVDRSRVHVERAELGHLQLRGEDEETQKKLDRVQVVVRKATWSVGLFILGLILLPIVGPPVLQLFL